MALPRAASKDENRWILLTAGLLLVNALNAMVGLGSSAERSAATRGAYLAGSDIKLAVPWSCGTRTNKTLLMLPS